MGDNALIGITVVNSTNNCKMRLWYSLSDDQKGSLQIAKRKSIGQNLNYLASLSNVSNNNWIRAEIDIQSDPTPFQVKN